MQSLEAEALPLFCHCGGDFLIKPSDPEYIVEIQATRLFARRDHTKSRFHKSATRR